MVESDGHVDNGREICARGSERERKEEKDSSDTHVNSIYAVRVFVCAMNEFAMLFASPSDLSQ